MPIASEPIFEKFFCTIRDSCGFATYSRRLRHWADTGTEEMPSLMVSEGRRVTQQTRGVPARWELYANLYIYVHEPDMSASPSEKLNPLIDAVCNTIQEPDDAVNHAQTLGGLVSHCWIESVETDEGCLGDLAVSIITVNFKLPD